MSDWYGTSFSLANSLMRASNEDGSRSDMDSVEDLRLGKTTLSAFDQSIYSVESCVAQKSASSSAFLKLGIFFKSLISTPFFSLHITYGYDSYFFISNGECDE